jgi:ABC-type branched-subunit amino acid transport system ATPase component
MDVVAKLAEHIVAARYEACPPDALASDRAYVLSTGSVVLEGRAQDQDEAIRKAYLG